MIAPAWSPGQEQTWPTVLYLNEAAIAGRPNRADERIAGENRTNRQDPPGLPLTLRRERPAVSPPRAVRPMNVSVFSGLCIAHIRCQ
jgi:hypothetical protein